MKLFVAFFLTLSISASSFSQLPSDSLLRVYKDKSAADTARLAALHYYIGNLLFTYPDSAEYLGLQEADLAKQTGNLKWEGWGYGYVAISYALRGQDHDAIPYYKKAIEVGEKIGDLDGVGSNCMNLGATFQKLGMLNSALELYIKASKVHDKIKDTSSLASVNGNIGAVYIEQREFEKAKIYLDRSLAFATLSKNLKVKAGALINLGNICVEEGKYDEAKELYREAYRTHFDLNNKFGIASSLDKIGTIQMFQNDFDSSAYYHNEAIKIHQELDDKEGLCESYISLSQVYDKKGSQQKAIASGKLGLEYAKETSYPFLIKDASYQLYRLYKHSNKIIQALEMYELSILMKDSISNEENRRITLRKAAEYEYEIRYVKDSIEQAQAALLMEAKLKAENLEKDMRRKEEAIAQEAETKRKSEQIYWLIGLLFLATIIGVIIYRGYLSKKNINMIISEQKAEVEEKNKEITDSINYAKRIQKAILPTSKRFQECLPNSFVSYLPKDIVAGDFYWMEIKTNENNEEITLFAAADCTGHGVPGAMVSVICNNGLNRAVREHGLTIPGEILDKTRDIVIREFDKSEEVVKDGMDIALCALNRNKLSYAGAHNPLWVIRKDSQFIEEYKADKQPIGEFENPLPYKTHELVLNSGDAIYLFSDGFVDQFGGERGKKYKASNFKTFLLSIKDLPMQDQKRELENQFANWKGDLEQLDDVCVIGVRL